MVSQLIQQAERWEIERSLEHLEKCLSFLCWGGNNVAFLIAGSLRAALSCVWWRILLRGEVDPACSANHLSCEDAASPFQLEDAGVLYRLG